jgi:general secretion pathway protein M
MIASSPSPAAARWRTATDPLRARWAALAPRERRVAAVATAVIVILLLWLVALRPAWQATRALPAEVRRLDAQLQQMQRLAAETRGLRGAAAVAPSQSADALRASALALGDGARLVVAGDRATLTLTDVAGDELQRWLLEAREGARARPVDVTLTRNPEGNFAGSVVVALPGAAQ